MASMKDLYGDTPAPLPSPAPHRAFDGVTYDAQRDHVRLKGQQEAVYELMKDGQWRTLRWISERLKQPEASISARLRDLRKVKYGSHVVDKECHAGGVWIYRVRVRG